MIVAIDDEQRMTKRKRFGKATVDCTPEFSGKTIVTGTTAPERLPDLFTLPEHWLTLRVYLIVELQTKPDDEVGATSSRQYTEIVTDVEFPSVLSFFVERVLSPVTHLGI